MPLKNFHFFRSNIHKAPNKSQFFYELICKIAPEFSFIVDEMTAMKMLLPLLALMLATASYARTDDTHKPVLLIHGWSPTQTGYDCNSYFANTISTLKAQGFSKIVTVGYYSNDKNCSFNLRQFDTSLTNDSSFKAIGAALSRYIQQHYTSTGQVVDLAGHSMGGLIMRAALQGASEKLTSFAPIMVEDAVTISTPHAGTGSASWCWATQCRAMAKNSTDLQWLAKNGNPQSLLPTDWTVIGSTSDELVTISSALSMSVDANHKQTYSGLSHLGILKDAPSNARVAAGLVEAAR